MANILLLGSYGRGNIGDDAFLISATRLLNGHRIVINASNDAPLPREVLNKVEIISTSGFSDLIKKIKFTLSADLLIYGGGDLWVELIGDKKPRKSLWSMCIINALMRMLGKKILYVGCGAGNLKGFSLILAKISAKLANKVIFRDEDSKKLLNIKSSAILPDITVTLFDDRPKMKIIAKKETIKVVVSALYFIPKPEINFMPYIKNLAKFIDGLKPENYDVIIAPMFVSNVTEKDDKWVAEKIVTLLKHRDAKIVIPKDFDDYKRIVSKSHIVIGSRLHANIIATWLGRPAIGIAYRPKVKHFFTQNNMQDKCLDFDNLSSLSCEFEKCINEYSYYSSRSINVWEQSINKSGSYRSLINDAL